MKKLFAVFVLIITAVIPLCAQSAASEKIALSYNIASYKYLDDSLYVVLSFSFSQGDPKYISRANLFKADLDFNVQFAGIKDTVSQQWNLEIPTENVEEKSKNIFIGCKQFALVPGEYDLKIAINDVNDPARLNFYESHIKLAKYEDEKLQMSDIEFAYQIDKVKNYTENINQDFVKSDLYFIPNPSCEIFGVSPEIQTYTEIYNYRPLKYDSVEFVYTLYNSLKARVLQSNHIRKPASPEFYDINLAVADTVPSGTYYMNISAKCIKKNKVIDSCSSEKKLFLINPQRKPELNNYFSEDQAYERSEFATFTNEQCDLEFRQVKIIASNAEREIWNKLNDYEAKRKYLFAFWNNRRAKDDGFANTQREDFRKLIEYCNKNYNEGGGRDGWDTDKGRITLKYGQPTTKDIYPAKDGNKPYEAWYYDAVGGSGAYFYFVDVSMNGRYKLVNSTIMDEVQNSDWRTRILPLDSKESTYDSY